MELSEKTISTACNITKGYEDDNGKDASYNITIPNLKEDTSAEDMVDISDAIDDLTVGSLSRTSRKQSKELVG